MCPCTATRLQKANTCSFTIRGSLITHTRKATLSSASVRTEYRIIVTQQPVYYNSCNISYSPKRSSDKRIKSWAPNTLHLPSFLAKVLHTPGDMTCQQGFSPHPCKGNILVSVEHLQFFSLTVWSYEFHFLAGKKICFYSKPYMQINSRLFQSSNSRGLSSYFPDIIHSASSVVPEQD